jgi:hypothetical protein
VGVDSGEEPVEVAAGECPFEWSRDLPVVVGEAEESFGERFERAELVGGERFALDDREVELDLDVPIDVKCGGFCWWRLLWSGWCRSVRRRS